MNRKFSAASFVVAASLGLVNVGLFVSWSLPYLDNFPNWNALAIAMSLFMVLYTAVCAFVFKVGLDVLRNVPQPRVGPATICAFIFAGSWEPALTIAVPIAVLGFLLFPRAEQQVN